MKLTITALLLSATAALSGPTENITGCATVAAEGSNYTTFADPTCYAAPDGGGADGFILAALIALIPDEEEDASE